MRFLPIILLFFFVDRCESFGSSQAEVSYKDSYRIVSYNVENLFDTWDEEYKFDDDFTPSGANRWTTWRYEKKIKDIGKVLVNAAGDKVPAVIGLIEVENKAVLEDLLENSPLRKFQYAIIHEESPDERGIDVALLYDTEQFNYIDYQIGRIEFPEDRDRTRDILMVKGTFGRDTVYFAVNHWPSRRGGTAETAPKRMYVAQKLREKTDAILTKQPNAHLIIMGDFNDSPTDASVAKGLGAGEIGDENANLINLMTERHKKGQGTYKYQNQWNMLDHFIVSSNLLDEEGKLFVTNNSLGIYNAEFLREQDPNYPGERIFRTYRGPNYVGGYSDHYPIVLDVFVR